VYRTLIIARMNAADADAIAKIFAESDMTELPHMVGVKRRTVFSFHDLYCHLLESNIDITPTLYKARSHPLYIDIKEKLGQYISPYDPGWQEPKDAMATSFYSWQAP